MTNNLPHNLNQTIFFCAVCGSVLSSYFHCTNINCPKKEPDLPSGYTTTSNINIVNQTIVSSASASSVETYLISDGTSTSTTT